MGPRVVGAETVYAAAEAWVERGLRTDDSLFTPGRPIWTIELLEELHRRFLDRPDESKDLFWTKLERQLAGSETEVHQLMVEVLYVYFIVDRRKDSTSVQAHLNEVLGWSDEAVAIPPEMVAGLTPVGAGNSVVVVDLLRWGPMLSPRVPHHVPIPGPRMERETPGQRPRPNCGHLQAAAREWGSVAGQHRVDGVGEPAHRRHEPFPHVRPHVAVFDAHVVGVAGVYERGAFVV